MEQVAELAAAWFTAHLPRGEWVELTTQNINGESS